jgi:tetratricopeptide (TPR) repeat protein
VGASASHVLYLTGVPAKPQVDAETFRTAIWKPIRDRLAAVPWGEDVDLIAYSAGFPYLVDFSKDVADAGAHPDQRISAGAALTAMTYLARRVERKDVSYLDLGVNRYVRRPSDGRPPSPHAPTDAERAAYEEAAKALQAGDHAAAAEAYRRLLATWPDHVESLYNLACCLARLGKADDALAELAKAVESGWANATLTEGDPDLASLRERPELAALLQRMRARKVRWQPTVAFRSRDAWTGEDAPATYAPESLDRYWLCVMLAYTGPRGTTAEEAVAYLGTAAASDGTQPKGTVYLMENGDVRAKTRMPLFDSAVAELEAMGRPARVLAAGKERQDGVLPQACDDVVGLVAGIAGFDWGPCKSRLLPGSIAEHLTSFGAAFEIAGQTKCTEFLKAGAAGTSGTVAEPFALQEKFPLPHLHVHYARGCSMAEAFYQSVSGPYQLLVLGDPLARPFATFASVALASPDPKAPWKGPVSVEARVAPAKDRPIRVVELWVDGAKVGEAAPGTAIPWDTTSSEDGAHDLRLVAVEEGPIATRSSSRALVHVANGSGLLKAKGPAAVDLGEPVRLTGSARGAKTVEVLLGDVVLASVPVRGGSWKAEIASDRLGAGTVTLATRATVASGPVVLGDPITVQVEPPKPPEPTKPDKKKR